MTSRPADTRSLTVACESLSLMIGLSFSLYDEAARLLILPAAEDPVISVLKASPRGRENYRVFVEGNLKVAAKRREPFVAKGPTSQYHAFIPLHSNDQIAVVLGEAAYDSPGEFKKFYAEKGAEIGLVRRSLEDWMKTLRFTPVQTIQDKLKSLQALFEQFFVSGYEKDELSRQSQWSKTIINMVSHLGTGTSGSDIYEMLVESVIFLFNVETAAVFVPRDGAVHAQVSTGRNRDDITSLTFADRNQLVARVRASGKALSITDSHELWHTGFPESIVSMYAFPLYSDSSFFGFMGVFNSELSDRAFESVEALCRLVGYILGTRLTCDSYEKKTRGLTLISLKVANLFFLHKEPQRLHDTIVEESSNLVGAEKSTLMMPSVETGKLCVSSVKGINRWLMETVKVGAGEGIAGKVFETGVPVLVAGEDTLRQYAISPRAHYRTSSAISLPLKIADEVIGILNLADKRSGDAFTEDDIATLEPFALQASIIIKLADCFMTAEQMRELSITDPLTNIYNRRYFNIRIDEEIQRAARHTLSFSLAIVDIDDFKLFNDTEGHLAGDHLLREIASIMTGSIRANDILARLGGEEFAIVMPQTTRDVAYHIAERVRENIKGIVKRSWKKFPREHVTVSIGIASYPTCGEPKENIIRCADKALYKAKMRGKDCTDVWEDEPERPGGSPPRGGDKPNDRISFL